MQVIVLTNPAAGAKADAIHELESALKAAGVTATVEQVPGGRLGDAAREAARRQPDAVVAAGGDGTVSAVASALAGTNVPLGIIPTGSLNHFARDLGMPLDLHEAARVIAARNVHRVDVAALNGRIFINNSSIGIYPHIVDQRDVQQERLGRGKWVSMVLACLSVFRRYPTVRVRIGVNDQTVLRTTPLVFVGNNRYEMKLTTLGRRARLDAGELSLWFATSTGRFGLFRLALRTILGRLEQSRDFEIMMVRQVWIETPKQQLRVALDGEVTRMSPPLHYEIRPCVLGVLVPPARSPQHSPEKRA